jgi:hypothetical protein
MISYFPDETPEYVEAYNVEMRGFVESGSCAPRIGYIDVFNVLIMRIERIDNAISE